MAVGRFIDMALIGSAHSFILAPSSDKYLTLANEEYLGKLAIGNDWTTLRIGVMCAMTPDGTNDIPGCSFQIGVCSSDAVFPNTAGVKDTVTKNYVGMDLFADRDTGAAFTAKYNAGSGNPYFNDSILGSQQVARRKVNTTGTFAGDPGAPGRFLYTNTGALQRRTPIYVDITKGGFSYSVTAWNPFFKNLDYGIAQFIAGFDTRTPTMNGEYFYGGTAAISCSESFGALDTVSVFWNQPSFPMEIYVIAAKRLE